MNSLPAKAAMRQWHPGPMAPDVSQALERLTQTEDVRYVAVMPDVHLAQEVCTGTVLATARRLYPQAVGNDIGCGMAALAFDSEASLLAGEQAAARVLAGLYRTVPSLRHSRRTMLDRLPEELALSELSHHRLEKEKNRDGRVQFATLGRGNHFIEFQMDEHGVLWLMVHSGSRAMGQAIAEYHLARAQPANTGLLFLDANSGEGQAYLADLDWAYRYADASRRTMVSAVAGLMKDLFGVSADPESGVYCNHNHVRQETHFGEILWVHRKGAISARLDEPGIIPGSMGTVSYLVAGRGCAAALCSSSHGAGRQMSRSQAFKSIPVREFCRQMREVWFDHRLAEKLRDEAPSAYKDIQGVMRCQRELTRITRNLRPILCFKGI
jgi:tRNA-splicing ligase RtcB